MEKEKVVDLFSSMSFREFSDKLWRESLDKANNSVYSLVAAQTMGKIRASGFRGLVMGEIIKKFK